MAKSIEHKLLDACFTATWQTLTATEAVNYGWDLPDYNIGHLTTVFVDGEQWDVLRCGDELSAYALDGGKEICWNPYAMN